MARHGSAPAQNKHQANCVNGSKKKGLYFNIVDNITPGTICIRDSGSYYLHIQSSFDADDGEVKKIMCARVLTK